MQPVNNPGWRDGFAQVVHYIAPHWDDAPQLLSGLRDCARRTAGAPPQVRAALLSFGFVYIHPMSDGNGRISRFLVNDALRRDGAVPEATSCRRPPRLPARW